MSVPDWQQLDLDEGVLREPTADPRRIVLWLPGTLEGEFRLWERIGNVPGAAIQAAQGLSSTPAAGVLARQQILGDFGAVLPTARMPTANPTWKIPDGGSAEQASAWQTNLLLVWAAEKSFSLELAHLQARWPQARRCQRLGRNLFLLHGIEPQAPRGEPAEGDPLVQAESLLAAARQAGDRPREVWALTDLGIFALRGGTPARAVAALGEALTLARLRRAGTGNRRPALPGVSAAGRPPTRACRGRAGPGAGVRPRRWQHARRENGAGSSGGGLRGRARLSSGHRRSRAGACSGRRGRDRQHQADLLWSLAIHRAELGNKDQAVGTAQAALALFAQLGSPYVTWLSEHLQKYQLADAGTGPATLPGVAHGWSTVISGGGPASSTPVPKQPVSGPGLLRMAMSAVTSLARFAASGARTVAPLLYQRRLDTCAPCEHHTGLRCRVCGCFTKLKAWMPHERCPLGKWPD